MARVLASVDLPANLLDSPDLPFPLPEQFRLLERAGRETGEIYFGAQLGREVRIGALSAFGPWVASAPTLGGAVDRANRGLNAYLQTGTDLALAIDEGAARWSIVFRDRGRRGKLQNELLGVSYLFDLMKTYLGRGWIPDHIAVTAPPSPEARRLERIFAAPVRLGAPVSALAFDPALLAAPRPSPHGAPLIDAIGSHGMPVPSARDQVEAAAAIIAIGLLERRPRVDWVARRLHLSRRTLQRRLAQSGVSFSALLDGLLKDRALALLRRPEVSLTAAAAELGYDDPAHFTRAFRRWTGRSPSAYRQLAAMKRRSELAVPEQSG